MKCGLVVQGPLFSSGRSGRTVHSHIARDHRLLESDIVHFDCVPNIVRIFEEFGGQFDRIVVTSWKSEKPEPVESLARQVGSDNVILLEDNTRQIPPKSALRPDNNKYRQIYSMLKGLEILSADGCEVGLKIRTDMFADYALLKRFALAGAKSGKVVVPYFDRHDPKFIADFYFGGETARLLLLCRRYLSKQEMYKSVHADLFYHWSFDIAPSLRFLYRWALSYKLSFINRSFLCDIWRKNYLPASEEILENSQWRGEKWERAQWWEDKFLFGAIKDDGEIVPPDFVYSPPE